MGNKQTTDVEVEVNDHVQEALTTKHAKPGGLSNKTNNDKEADKVTMAMSKVGVDDLAGFGIRLEIAEALVENKNKGRLKTLTDIVNVLEKSGGRCKIKFEENFEFEVDSDGEILLQSREQEAQPVSKRKRRSGWSSGRWGKQKHHEASEDKTDDETADRKTRGFKFNWPSQKKRSKEPQNDDDFCDAEDQHEDEEFEGEEREKIDINTASSDDLQAIKGIGPSLARKIVEHREKRGVFRQIEELSAVKGISRHQIEKLSSKLSVGELDSGPGMSMFKLNPVPSNGILQHGGREVIRLMSWNLQCFGEDKADNEGVMEVICTSILKSGVSVAVIQEIGDETGIQKIVEELNHPTIKNVKKFKKHKCHWECVTSDIAGSMFRSREYNAFLFDTSRKIELKSHDLLEKPKKGKKQFARRPFLGYFKASGFDFVVVSVHLKATGLGGEDLGKLQKELVRIPDILTAIKEQIPGEKDMVIVGDFNLDPDEKAFESFHKAGLVNLIPSWSFTNISTSNMDGSKCYDNIWISTQTKNHYSTGHAGVLRDGMLHPAIPDGWKKNGVVSDHCPVWAQFYCDRDVDKSAGDAVVDDIIIQ